MVQDIRLNDITPIGRWIIYKDDQLPEPVIVTFKDLSTSYSDVLERTLGRKPIEKSPYSKGIFGELKDGTKVIVANVIHPDVDPDQYKEELGKFFYDHPEVSDNVFSTPFIRIYIVTPKIEKEAKLVRRYNKNRKRTEWALVSRSNPKKVLRWFGSRKPSKQRLVSEERRVQWFKHKGSIKNAWLVEEIPIVERKDEHPFVKDDVEIKRKWLSGPKDHLERKDVFGPHTDTEFGSGLLKKDKELYPRWEFTETPQFRQKYAGVVSDLYLFIDKLKELKESIEKAVENHNILVDYFRLVKGFYDDIVSGTKYSSDVSKRRVVVFNELVNLFEKVNSGEISPEIVLAYSTITSKVNEVIEMAATKDGILDKIQGISEVVTEKKRKIIQEEKEQYEQYAEAVEELPYRQLTEETKKEKLEEFTKPIPGKEEAELAREIITKLRTQINEIFNRLYRPGIWTNLTETKNFFNFLRRFYDYIQSMEFVININNLGWLGERMKSKFESDIKHYSELLVKINVEALFGNINKLINLVENFADVVSKYGLSEPLPTGRKPERGPYIPIEYVGPLRLTTPTGIVTYYAPGVKGHTEETIEESTEVPPPSEPPKVESMLRVGTLVYGPEETPTLLDPKENPDLKTNLVSFLDAYVIYKGESDNVDLDGLKKFNAFFEVVSEPNFDLPTSEFSTVLRNYRDRFADFLVEYAKRKGIDKIKNFFGSKHYSKEMIQDLAELYKTVQRKDPSSEVLNVLTDVIKRFTIPSTTTSLPRTPETLEVIKSDIERVVSTVFDEKTVNELKESIQSYIENHFNNYLKERHVNFTDLNDVIFDFLKKYLEGKYPQLNVDELDNLKGSTFEDTWDNVVEFLYKKNQDIGKDVDLVFKTIRHIVIQSTNFVSDQGMQVGPAGENIVNTFFDYLKEKRKLPEDLNLGISYKKANAIRSIFRKQTISPIETTEFKEPKDLLQNIAKRIVGGIFPETCALRQWIPFIADIKNHIQFVLEEEVSPIVFDVSESSTQSISSEFEPHDYDVFNKIEDNCMNYFVGKISDYITKFWVSKLQEYRPEQ